MCEEAVYCEKRKNFIHLFVFTIYIGIYIYIYLHEGIAGIAL